MGGTARNAFCLLGLPLDAVTMAEAVRQVRDAVTARRRLFFSTPNLNFLIGSQGNKALRDSVIDSDLSLADGMPLVWLAQLLGLPIRERVSGSGLFECLMRESPPAGSHPIKVYFYGGPPGVAEVACAKLNAQARGLVAVGYASPGFGTVEEISGQDAIDHINASGAEFLVVALGAAKGQAWILRNLDRLQAPVISHLGAVVNFAAGTVSRAPAWVQKTGLEWLWRIKEEPALWRRYWADGLALVRLFFGQVLPYALWLQSHRPAPGAQAGDIRVSQGPGGCRLDIEGAMPDDLPTLCRAAFDTAGATAQPVVVDVSRATYLGPGFFGLLLVLRKQANAAGTPLRIAGVTDPTRRLFHWNGVEFLLGGI